MIKTNKPHKGVIENWKKIPCVGGLGYCIYGQPKGHPSFVGWVRTSFVVAQEENAIETNKSVYTLGEPFKEEE